MANAIDIRNFSFRYGSASASALSDVSLSIVRGSCCALLGASKSGKSTLLHACSGSLGRIVSQFTAKGEIEILGTLHTPMPATILFPQVALAHQEASLMLSGMYETVREELQLTLDSLESDEQSAQQRIQWVLRLLAVEQLAERNPVTLSGGELHKVAIGTVLVSQPPILLLDEPTVGLDQHSQFELAHIIRTLSSTLTVVFSEATIDLALLSADRIAVLHGGRIQFQGEREEFLNRLDEFEDTLPKRTWTDIRAAASRTDSHRL